MTMEPSVRDKIEIFFKQYPVGRYAKGEMITFANDEHNHVLYITDGVVGQYDITAAGNKTFVNLFKPPAFFPMSWAINRKSNEYYFEAVTDVCAHKADPDEAVAFIRSNPDVMFDLLSRVYIGTDALLRRLAIAGSSASRRLALELVIAGYRFGERRDDGVLVTMGHADLATHSGLSRETVTRALHTLRDAGLLRTAKGSVLLTDLPGLEAWYMQR